MHGAAAAPCSLGVQPRSLPLPFKVTPVLLVPRLPAKQIQSQRVKFRVHDSVSPSSEAAGGEVEVSAGTEAPARKGGRPSCPVEQVVCESVQMCTRTSTVQVEGLPGGSVVEIPPVNARKHGFNL